jgi:sortase A
MANKFKQKFIDYFQKGANSNFFIKIAAVLLAAVLIVLVQWGIARKSESDKKAAPSSQNQVQEEKPIEVSEFHLYIPKIKVDVPIVPNVDGGSETAYLAALENGVAHFQGTALPGEGSNIFIFGHSSYYAAKPGNYKTVFAQLDQLKIGDEITVSLNNQKYVYIVSSIKKVNPSDVQYLQPTPEEQLSLMTCYPPGTTKYRLIVIAKPK